MEALEKNLPTEETVDGGLGLLVRHKMLFHGSSVSGIEKLNPAEETTIGDGVYFTSDRKDAEGYAIRRSRSRKDSKPLVYVASIENLKFFDARNDSNAKTLLNGFLDILIQERMKEDLPWNKEAILDEAIEKIKLGKVSSSNLREVGFAHGKLFTNYVKFLGYDGLIAFEGGEGDDVGNHDTYLVFDQDKVGNISTD
jgi:hypothetical protein